MSIPTREEVIEYFKDAEEIEDAHDNSELGYFEKDNVEFYKDGNGCSWLQNPHKDNWLILWSNRIGYAKITKYKTSPSVKNPKAKHYELWQDFEVIDLIKKQLTKDEYIGALKFNILKYKLRNKGQDESDNEKAKDYQNELNDFINKELEQPREVEKKESIVEIKARFIKLAEERFSLADNECFVFMRQPYAHAEYCIQKFKFDMGIAIRGAGLDQAKVIYKDGEWLDHV